VDGGSASPGHLDSTASTPPPAARAAARAATCDALVTRNPRDFTGAPVRVLTPAEILAWLRAGA